jgi:hypothetical protein
LILKIYGEQLANDSSSTYEVHVAALTFQYYLGSPIVNPSSYWGGGSGITTYLFIFLFYYYIYIFDIRTYNPLLVSSLGAPPSLCILVKNYTELSVALYLIFMIMNSFFIFLLFTRYKLNPRTDLGKWVKYQPTDKLNKDSVKQELLG